MNSILKATIIAAIFVSPSSLLKAEDAPAKTNAVIKGVRVLSQVVNGSNESLKSNSHGEYGGGTIIGRPVKAALKGLLFKTYELNVNQGGFSDSNFYLGSVVHLSTDSKEVFDKFQTLDQEKSYIFEYKRINPFNPEIEDSHLQVTAIHTPEEYLKKLNVTSIPAEIKSGDSHQGPYSNGIRRGRIVDIERYGFFENFCYFELNVGGLKSQNSGNSTEALLDITVLDESICKYVEEAIALGQDVEIAYTQDFIEMWQPSTYYCKGIKCLPHVATATTSDGTAVKRLETPLSSPDLEKIKKELLNDPEFLNSLVNALKERSK
jgi:hypothetical protein